MLALQEAENESDLNKFVTGLAGVIRPWLARKTVNRRTVLAWITLHAVYYATSSKQRKTPGWIRQKELLKRQRKEKQPRSPTDFVASSHTQYTSKRWVRGAGLSAWSAGPKVTDFSALKKA